MQKPILYNYFRSSPSFRVRIALNIKKIDFEYRPIHLLNNGGEQYSSEYAEINPAQEVPCFIHEGRKLAQSVAIIEYLDDIFPDHRLYPTAPFQKAQVREFCEHINSGMHPVNNLKILQRLTTQFSATDAQKIQWAQEWLQRGFSSLESILKTTAGSYCFGGHLSAADIFLVPMVFASSRFSFDISKFPICSRINETCLQLEVFKKAHPFRQIDTPEDLRIA